MNRDFMILCLLLIGFKEENICKLNDEELYKLVHQYCFGGNDED